MTFLAKLVYAHLNSHKDGIVNLDLRQLFCSRHLGKHKTDKKASLINCIALYGIWSALAWFLFMRGINSGFNLC